MPNISILMPVYNSENFLDDAIKSIIEQTQTDWELVIINDGSTDNSESIIKAFSDYRIKYYKNNENIGLIGTLNKGIKYCEGKYIARMDADDISLPNRLKEQFSFLEKNKDYSMCGCNGFIIDEIGDEIGRIYNLYTNDYLQINLLFSVPFIHPGMMIRSNILHEEMYDPTYKHAEDYDLWCRISLKSKVANIPQFLIKYRWHTNNVSVKNSDHQDNLKNKIIQRELKQNLGINADSDDLYLHKISFEQYNAKENKEFKPFNRYEDLNKWFKTIITANQSKQRYNQSALIAYLWSRWIVLCVSQKKYTKIFKPQFVSFNLSVCIRTFHLIYLLSKK